MAEKEGSSNSSEQNAQEIYNTILESLHTLAVAVTALSDAQLQIGNPETGPAAFLKVTSEKGLTIRYKPDEKGLVPKAAPPPNTPQAPEPVTANDQNISAEEAKDRRVQLSGRLGAEPYYKQTREGKLLVRFPLATVGEDDKMEWRKVFSLDKHAEKIQKLGLVKGQAINVFGYEQETVSKKPKSKSAPQIYAVAVKPTGKKKNK